MSHLTVKPRDGLRIRDPERKDFIEDAGRVVPQSTYWLRRVRDGDVVIVEHAVGGANISEPVVEAAPKTPRRRKLSPSEVSPEAKQVDPAPTVDGGAIAK